MLVMTAFYRLSWSRQSTCLDCSNCCCRELAVTGLRLFISRTWRSNGRSLAGKVKTATQMVAIILLFINNIPFSALHLPLDQIMLYACDFHHLLWC